MDDQENDRDAVKKAVFEALAQAGYVRVRVEFDGGGDSGSVSTPEFFKMGTPPPDPNAPTAVVAPVEMIVDAPDESLVVPKLVKGYWGPGDDETTSKVAPVAEVIDELCYDLLETTGMDWVNNEGAYGEFEFNVAARTISLEFNERIYSSNLHDFEF